jgi:hypothetical protein
MSSRNARLELANCSAPDPSNLRPWMLNNMPAAMNSKICRGANVKRLWISLGA